MTSCSRSWSLPEELLLEELLEEVLELEEELDEEPTEPELLLDEELEVSADVITAPGTGNDASDFHFRRRMLEQAQRSPGCWSRPRRFQPRFLELERESP